MIAYFKRLFTHAQWADARTFQSIIESQHLPAHALETFAHVMAAEHVWLNRLRGTPISVLIWPTLSIAECDTLMHENHAGYSALLGGLDDSALTTSVAYRNSAGREFTSTMEDMLTQVATHGCYHRGQIAALVRAGGDTPQPTDFIAFARGTPAAARPGV